GPLRRRPLGGALRGGRLACRGPLRRRSLLRCRGRRWALDGAAGVEVGLELHSRREADPIGRLDVDGCTGLGGAAPSRLTLTELERPEARHPYRRTGPHSVRDLVDHRVERGLSLDASQTRILADRIDELRSVHWHLLKKKNRSCNTRRFTAENQALSRWRPW